MYFPLYLFASLQEIEGKGKGKKGKEEETESGSGGMGGVYILRDTLLAARREGGGKNSPATVL